MTAADGTRLAFARRAGRGPGLVFLPGYRSDMAGTKAQFLDAWCAARGQALLRFDYAGHGASGGVFEEGTIGRWANDAVTVIDQLSEGPQVLVGSSMGGWIMLEAALARPERIAGLVGIAAAPDFTEDLVWERLPPARREELLRAGHIVEPNPYDQAGYRFSLALIEEGRTRLRLRGPIGFAGPVRLLHGMLDAEVPWQTSLRLAQALEGADVRLTLLKESGHRLSAPEELALLGTTLGGLLGQDGG